MLKENGAQTCQLPLQEDGHLFKHISAQLIDIRLCRLHSLLCCLHTTVTWTQTLDIWISTTEYKPFQHSTFKHFTAGDSRNIRQILQTKQQQQ